MRKTEEIYNRLIEFDRESSLIRCENIIKEMDEIITFNHYEVTECYDREDRVYDIIMHFRANDILLKLIKDYLDGNGFKDCYVIYNKLSN